MISITAVGYNTCVSKLTISFFKILLNSFGYDIAT